MLGVIAIVALRTPPRIVTGLPREPAVTAVRDRVHDRLAIELPDLRFETALLGRGGTTDVALATEAGQALLGVPERGDPRVPAARGALELGARRYADAERSYRRAVEMAPSYGEARMGLGVTLALRAAGETDEDRARGLRLRAIAQFAAVPEPDPGYTSALYDRALLLARVGRRDEARRWAERYRALDPASVWSANLDRELDAPPR
jgi:Flp pilus assembly protein TadD